MTPVRLLSRHGISSPLVLDSPHSGVEYPEDFQYAVNLSDLRRAEDTHVDTLFDFCPELGASLVAASFPRSYIDANRSLDEIDPELLETAWPQTHAVSKKARLGKGLVWRLLDDGQSIYQRKLSVAEVEQRINHYWRPYHAMVRGALDDAYSHHGFVIHINCHSMPSVSDLYTTDRPGLVHPDIVLGDRDGSSADPAITAFLKDAFLSRGYSCWVNDPYKGVELVRAYSDPATDRHSIQLELNRRLYMDEKTLEPHQGFGQLRADLQYILSELLSYCQPRWAAKSTALTSALVN
jgi:N-formylglutamate amidohydrolase